MSLRIRSISNKLLWESFNLSLTPASVFQSWNMGEAWKKNGEKIDRLGFYDGEKLCGIAQTIDVKAKRGYFIHIRGGPIFRKWRDFLRFFPLIKEFAKNKRTSFIRISPPILASDDKNAEIINKLGFKNSPIPLLDAEAAWVLDLNKNEEELLSNMRKTTRYLIRKARKIGVTIIKSQDQKAISNLLKLYQIMTAKKGIVPHRGIVEEFKEFVKDDQALVFLGYFQNKLLGAALILFYGNEAIYHHSAHLRTLRDIPVSYLLQWEAIKEAKRRGKGIYNFWGIEPTGNKKHPWYGLTLFKMGFGGHLRQFIRASDYPLSPIYAFTWLIESLRRIKRYKIYI